MPVPTVITDLSTTAASNSPAGSDAPGPDGDNYFRAHAAFIAQLYAGKTSVAAGMLKSDSSAIAVGVAGTDYLAPAAIGVTVQAYDADIPTVAASQAEMEAGTEPAVRSISPLRVAQAITAQTNPLTAMTAQASTSGTSIDFTSIPSWVKRITVALYEVSLSGTDSLLLQVGDAGGYETTGYLGSSQVGGTSGGPTTSGLLVSALGSAILFANGQIVLSKIDGNKWGMHSVCGFSNTAGVAFAAASKELSATLDRLRIIPSGANTFDSGLINVLYE